LGSTRLIVSRPGREREPINRDRGEMKSEVRVKNLIVIPAFNEEEALPRMRPALESLPPGYEVLLVNDGSTDRTGEVAERLARQLARPLHVVHLPLNSGIGAAVQTGYLFAASRGGYDYVIQFDGDGQHPAEAIPELVKACVERGLDLCIGSRFLVPRAEGFQSTFLRRVGIRFFARLIGLLTGAKVTDPTSGFRCAGVRAWSSFARRYPEDYPEPESLFWCARNGLKVGEVAVRMHERQGGVSSIGQLRSVYYMVKVSLAILMDGLRSREQCHL
jgi:glycosyltransferase involved in cell wall biosynthesis